MSSGQISREHKIVKMSKAKPLQRSSEIIARSPWFGHDTIREANQNELLRSKCH